MKKMAALTTLAMVVSFIDGIDAAEASAGMTALGELNCTACHSASAEQAAWITPKPAPRLTDIGKRVSADWLQSYLASPQKMLPGVTMPDLLHGNAQQSEALTHYLISQGGHDFRRVTPDKAAVARGESLYHSVGCVACHAPQNGAKSPPDSVPLPNLSEKWAFAGLKKFLLDPQAIRPSGRMPGMHLTEAEAADVAHYLLRGTQLPGTAEVAFYRGRIRTLESLDSAEMARTVPATGLILEGPMLDRGVAFRITTWLTVKQAGEYTFFLKAKGSSRLSIAGRWSLGEESWDTQQVDEKYQLDMAPGHYELKLDYVQRGKIDPGLAVEWQGPGFSRQPIPLDLLSNEREPAAKPMLAVPVFQVDPAKTEEGRLLYNSLNCATCHEGKAPVESLPDLAKVKPTLGCLADAPTGTAPDFHLDTQRREAIRKELAGPKPAAPTQKERVALTIISFRCLSCHVRDGAGGITPERSAFFTSNVDDLGDQGRIPPNLDGVGDKLRPEWLQKVMAEGAGVRPYLNTRMPQFGADHVGNLAGLFIALDRHAQAIAPVKDAPELQREVGRKLIGTDGLSCIACHRFNRQPAHSMQVLDLSTLTERLNEDWLRRFLRNPNEFQPGTRMPGLWPNGKSLLPTLLDGDTDRQHSALWTYLSDGAAAKFPEGLSRKNLEIIVGGEAVVYSGKLWEAGFRAIATGYPGQMNVAFDAEEVRLAILWRGRFLDASPHWSNQGMGKIQPLGTDVTLFPHGSPFAILADSKSPWPSEPSKALGMKFSGYQVDKLKRPTLLYAFQKTAIEDFISSTGKSTLHRTIKFTSPPPDGLHFRIATGKLMPSGQGAWRLNDKITIKIKGGGTPIMRGKGEEMELIIPVRPTEQKPQLEIDYVW